VASLGQLSFEVGVLTGHIGVNDGSAPNLEHISNSYEVSLEPIEALELIDGDSVPLPDRKQGVTPLNRVMLLSGRRRKATGEYAHLLRDAAPVLFHVYASWVDLPVRGPFLVAHEEVGLPSQAEQERGEYDVTGLKQLLAPRFSHPVVLHLHADEVGVARILWDAVQRPSLTRVVCPAGRDEVDRAVASDEDVAERTVYSAFR